VVLPKEFCFRESIIILAAVNTTIMKKLLLLVTLILSAFFAYSQDINITWSDEGEKLLREGVDEELTRVGLSESQKQVLITCLMGKLKSRYPDGIKATKEEFKALNYEIGRECAKEANIIGVPKWSAANEESFKRGILRSLPDWGNEDTTNKFVNCFVEGLKVKFPDGFLITEESAGELNAIMAAVRADCLKKIPYNSVLIWNPKNENLLKTMLAEYLVLAEKEDEQAKVLDCVILKLKGKYPKGLVVLEMEKGTYVEEVAVLEKECIKELAKPKQ
jgi:hypothetical protein